MMKKLGKILGKGRSEIPNREGFTLVEIIMVLFILSVGILPLVAIQHMARRKVNESDNYTQAMLVAQDHLERIKGLGFGNAVADSGQVGRITWVCTVTNQSFGLDRIEMRTSWQDRGDVRSVIISDIVSMR